MHSSLFGSCVPMSLQSSAIASTCARCSGVRFVASAEQAVVSYTIVADRRIQEALRAVPAGHRRNLSSLIRHEAPQQLVLRHHEIIERRQETVRSRLVAQRREIDQ